MRKLKALVIDNSGEMRTRLMDSLRKSGLAEFEFSESEDGVDALLKFDSKETDIVFADWNLPRMTGIEFVRKVRSNPKNLHVPIVMVTSEQTIGRIHEALDAAGAVAYICKPFTIADLERKLKKVVAAIPEKPAKPPGFFARLMS